MRSEVRAGRILIDLSLHRPLPFQGPCVSMCDRWLFWHRLAARMLRGSPRRAGCSARLVGPLQATAIPSELLAVPRRQLVAWSVAISHRSTEGIVLYRTACYGKKQRAGLNPAEESSGHLVRGPPRSFPSKLRVCKPHIRHIGYIFSTT